MERETTLNADHPELVSVLTGDLIGYSQRTGNPEGYLSTLEAALKLASRHYSFNFQIFRGDSFQGLLLEPSRSLEVALLIRSFLISRMDKGSFDLVKGPGEKGEDDGRVPSGARKRYDARIAIGIGTVDFYDLNKIGQSDGEAFRMSGRRLDEMKRRRQELSIVTPWDELNDELEVECALLDVIVSKWTRDQAQSVFYALLGMNQVQISERLGRSQGGISQRLSKAGYPALVKMLARFDEKINRGAGHTANPSVL